LLVALVARRRAADAAHAVPGVAGRHAQVFGTQEQVLRTGFGMDGPATLLEANGHRADERVPLAELKQATQVVANVLLELLTPSATGSATG
jgi:acetylornithine deacetylase/succinyl-diaminopimelate desuccinylase-like protein